MNELVTFINGIVVGLLIPSIIKNFSMHTHTTADYSSDEDQDDSIFDESLMSDDDRLEYFDEEDSLESDSDESESDNESDKEIENIFNNPASNVVNSESTDIRSLARLQSDNQLSVLARGTDIPLPPPPKTNIHYSSRVTLGDLDYRRKDYHSKSDAEKDELIRMTNF